MSNIEFKFKMIRKNGKSVSEVVEVYQLSWLKYVLSVQPMSNINTQYLSM